jgi:hypothetical protein
MPTASDLVTDLPADFETFGQAVATSMADLLGGTTGQVLSKASNTDMDFTWVAQDDSNAIQNAIVDAKGDLIGATAADTPARLAVGNNGENLVADSSTATGLRYQSGYNGNSVINGGMDVWQRGTTIVGTSGIPHTADRWQVTRTGTTGYTTTRQATNDTTNLPNIQYCARVQRDSGNTNTSLLGAFYSMESSDSIRFAGQAATLSFWARKGANFSQASSGLTVEFSQGTGTDQNIISGGFTGKTNVGGGTATLTTTWQRFTYTGTVATTTTQLGLQFYYTPVGTAGAADFFEITGVQVELGSVPTVFKRSNGSGGTIQGELAACQRYFYAINQSTGGAIGNGGYFSTTQYQLSITFPVVLRTAASFTRSAAAAIGVYRNGGATASTAIALDATNVQGCDINVTTATSVVGQAGFARFDGSNNYLWFSAEL